MSDLRKILLLSANPKGTPQVRLDEEMREIEEGLLRSRQRSQFTIETATAVRYRDLRRLILRHEPHIVHFSGHGEGEEGLVFEDETGQTKFVNFSQKCPVRFSIRLKHMAVYQLSQCVILGRSSA